MMKFICPLITVTDIKRSRIFYENVLNQKVAFDFGQNVSFAGGFAIHLRSHYKELIGNKEIRPGGNDFELYFEFDDLESFVAKLLENQVIFVHQMREQPWRQRVVRFYDPDEHIVEVGESMEYLSYRLSKEGMTAEEIAGATELPADFIKGAVESFSKANNE